MEFTNSFSVDAPMDVAWSFFLRAEEVAPCVPGASITEQVDDTHYKGTVKVKLGAVQMSYRGELEMIPDEAARTITLRAKGTESRGSGGASGTFTTRLTDREGGGTNVEILSQVDVTGKVAQFGRGIMQDVANRMIKDFAACLEQKIRTAGEVAESPVEQSAAVDHTLVESTPVHHTPTVPAGVTPQESLPAAPRMSSSTDIQPPAAATEIRLGRIVADLTRQRVARGLRLLAQIIEPK